MFLQKPDKQTETATSRNSYEENQDGKKPMLSEAPFIEQKRDKQKGRHFNAIKAKANDVPIHVNHSLKKKAFMDEL